MYILIKFQFFYKKKRKKFKISNKVKPLRNPLHSLPKPNEDDLKSRKRLHKRLHRAPEEACVSFYRNSRSISVQSFNSEIPEDRMNADETSGLFKVV